MTNKSLENQTKTTQQNKTIEQLEKKTIFRIKNRNPENLQIQKTKNKKLLQQPYKKNVQNLPPPPLKLGKKKYTQQTSPGHTNTLHHLLPLSREVITLHLRRPEATAEF